MEVLAFLHAYEFLASSYDYEGNKAQSSSYDYEDNKTQIRQLQGKRLLKTSRVHDLHRLILLPSSDLCLINLQLLRKIEKAMGMKY